MRRRAFIAGLGSAAAWPPRHGPQLREGKEAPANAAQNRKNS